MCSCLIAVCSEYFDAIYLIKSAFSKWESKRHEGDAPSYVKPKELKF